MWRWPGLWHRRGRPPSHASLAMVRPWALGAACPLFEPSGYGQMGWGGPATLTVAGLSGFTLSCFLLGHTGFTSEALSLLVLPSQRVPIWLGLKLKGHIETALQDRPWAKAARRAHGRQPVQGPKHAGRKAEEHGSALPLRSNLPLTINRDTAGHGVPCRDRFRGNRS